MLNTKFKILASVLAKTLMLVVGSLEREAQTCTTLNASIHDNLHLMEYIIEKAETEAGFGGALINLDQLKVFDRVDHLYLEAVLKVDGFRLVFRSWFAEVYTGIYLVVKVNGYLS